MNKLKLYGCLLLMLLCVQRARAQSADWNCDPHDYQFDMTVYPTLTENETPVEDLGNYEVAAFVGDECRGIAELVTTPTAEQYLYLRVYSNTATGETITFKAYDKTTGEEVDIEADALTFESNTTQGTPSDPLALALKSYTLGDVNGDGKITIFDASLTINRYLGLSVPNNFNEKAADMNGDGKITIFDASQIINKYLGQ